MRPSCGLSTTTTPAPITVHQGSDVDRPSLITVGIPECGGLPAAGGWCDGVTGLRTAERVIPQPQPHRAQRPVGPGVGDGEGESGAVGMPLALARDVGEGILVAAVRRERADQWNLGIRAQVPDHGGAPVLEAP